MEPFLLIRHLYRNQGTLSFYRHLTTSSVPKGTVLKGINILKDGKDPIAKSDDEYPRWLWDLLAPKKKEWTPEEQLSRRYLRYRNEQMIKENALKTRK